MGNLALTFPDLAPASFQPWVNESEAQAEGITVDELRRADGDDLARGPRSAGHRPRAAPGAAGRGRRDDLHARLDGRRAAQRDRLAARARPLSWDTEAETLRDEIEGTVTSLLALVGITADPLVEPRARAALEPDRERLARRPRPRPRHADRRDPVSPAPQARRLRDRPVLPAHGPHRARVQAQRAHRLAVASPPGARAQPLDPQTLLFTAEGKPRCAIVYLAHLSDEERQFVVTLVFSKLVTWMRGQSGTSDLRALAYMDEVVRLRAADAPRRRRRSRS